MKAPPWYGSILTCPDCEIGLDATGDGALRCSSCRVERPLTPNADFKPRQQRSVQMKVPINGPFDLALAGIALGRPERTYRGPAGTRDATELLSLFQQNLGAPGRVLDLGCGPRDQADGIMSLGHEYVGVDYSNKAADLLVDAHALPFASSSFDAVFSYAVLEHLYNPFRALSEIARVLKPAGFMCGTVSQGEPFHGSFFHHTAWGVVSACSASGFQVKRLWACWDTLDGLADMGRYSRPVRMSLRLASLINTRLPFLSPRKMKWPVQDLIKDELHRAASIGFLIQNAGK